MPPKKQPTVWKAEPHTIAKIEVLQAYLHAWFPILGLKRPGQDLLYIDGFAGPGKYSNHPTGSPIAALVAALNETPFTNPKSMLAHLEAQNAIRVVSSDPKRRRGTFNEEKLLYIEFEP